VAPPEEPEPEPALPDPDSEPAPRSAGEAEGGVVKEVLGSSVFRSFARSAASAAGREISRSIFGTAPRRRRRRR
jgi:hypothetical protein